MAERVRSLDVLSAIEDERAALFAKEQRALAAVFELLERPPANADRAATSAVEFVALDVAMATGVTQITASRRLEQALHLVHRLPGTLALVESGELTVGQALVLREETATLPAETCAAVEHDVLPTVLGKTSADTRRAVRRSLARLDAKNADERREARRRERRAFVTPKSDGQGLLGVLGSGEDTSRFFDQLTLLARMTFGADDVRTLDQQRADLALSLAGFALAGRHGHGPSLRGYLGLAVEDDPGCSLADTNRLTAAQLATLQAVVVVPVETALGISDNPAELVGYGPITAEHARELLASAELRHATADQATGRLVGLSDQVVRRPRGLPTWPTRHFFDDVVEIDTGPPPPPPPITLQDALLAFVHGPQPLEARLERQHDPGAGLTRFLRLRDVRCHGPGCSQPAHLCDLEHWTRHPFGPTAAVNVAPVSRRCHNAKTYGGWAFTPHPDGSVTWTSPLGRSWVRESRTEPVQLGRLRSLVGVVPPGQRRAAA